MINGASNYAGPIGHMQVGLTEENENDTFTADRTGPTDFIIFSSFNLTIRKLSNIVSEIF